MKVVVASPGAGTTRRGYEVFAIQLTDHLRAAGIDVALLAGGEVEGAERVPVAERRTAAARVLARGMRVQPHSIEQYTFAVAAAPTIRRLAPDVVVASESVLFGLWKRMGAIIGRRPRFVLTNGGSRRPPFRSVDAVVHHAADLCRLAAATEPDQTHLHLPCPVPVPAWDEVVAARGGTGRAATRASLGLPADAFVVASIGAIDRAVKRTDLVAHAVASLDPAVDAHLLLLGRAGIDDADLPVRIQAQLGRRVVITEVDPDAVGRTLACADVHVSASPAEGFGRVFLEAQAWGLPNILHDTERSRTVTGGIGHFVDTDDTAAISRALQAIAAAHAGPDPRAWDHACESGWAELGPRYVEAFTTIAAMERSG